MDKIIIMFVCGMAAIMVLLLVTRWVTYTAKKKLDEGEALNFPIAVWIASIFGAGSIIMYQVLVSASVAVDIWNKLKPAGAIKDILVTCSLLIGMGACWLLLLVGITAGFITVVLKASSGKAQQAEVHALGYYVIRGMFLLGGCLLLLPVAEELLRLCLPVFNLTYFH